MNDFKMLALRPLKGCNPDYLKKIQPGYLFKFNSGFEIVKDGSNHMENILKFESRLPSQLYNLSLDHEATTKNIPIDISAIVGKNGSGKSSLIELFFLAVYNFSVEKGILKSKSEREEMKNAKPLFYESDIKIELFYKLGENLYCLHIAGDKDVNPKKNIATLYEYKLSKDGNWSYSRIVPNHTKHLFDYFFYTIAINYSIYSLNSELVGDWIEPLFHKNDSYQTPIVINPMRTMGNIDIQVENELVGQRLLSNILQPIDKMPGDIELEKLEKSLRNLAPGKNAKYLNLIPDPIKEKKYAAKALVEDKDPTNLFYNFYHQYTGSKILSVEQNTELWSLMNFIKYKLKKICQKYPLYHKFLKENRFTDTDKLINALIRDESHVTFKLKQAANHIQYYEDIQKTKEANGWINIQEYSKYIQVTIAQAKKNNIRLQVIELIPPAIHQIQILFDDNKHKFDDFSSGEKQKVHSINSILYHLINLNSVFNNSNDPTHALEILNKYNHINIVFDEIELYFHPDLQRSFVNDLLSSLGKMNPMHLWSFDGFQFIFITHSPFILSDIPSTNILYLNSDQTSGTITAVEGKGETFGANIHDLLANDFFMERGFMGELAKNKITSVIEHLQSLIKPPSYRKENQRWSEPEVRSLIDIIGEPMIKKSILDLYFAAYGDDAIDKEIKRLQILRDKTKKKKTL
jgi:predicted ATPase